MEYAGPSVIRFEWFDGASVQSASLSARNLTVGRDAGNSISIASTSVSRHHALIEWHQGAYRITDLGSGNGIWVNGERVSKFAVSEGCEFLIGDTPCRMSVEDRLWVAEDGVGYCLPEGEIVVGRDPGCDLVFSHPTVSARHLRMETRPDGVFVTALASQGVLVDGLPVGSGRLNDACTITLGALRFIFVDIRRKLSDHLEITSAGSANLSGRVYVAIAFIGRLDASEQAFREQLKNVTDGKQLHILLDASAVTHVNADGLDCLIAAAQALTSKGGELVLRAPSPPLARALLLSRASRLIRIV